MELETCTKEEAKAKKAQNAEKVIFLCLLLLLHIYILCWPEKREKVTPVRQAPAKTVIILDRRKVFVHAHLIGILNIPEALL